MPTVHELHLEQRIKRLQRMGLSGRHEDQKDFEDSLRLLAQKTELSDLDFLCIRDLLAHCAEVNSEVLWILALLFLSRSEGSLCLNLEEDSIFEKLSSIKGREAAEALASELFTWTQESISGGHELVSRVWMGDSPERPLVLEKMDEFTLLYFHQSFHQERLLWEGVERLSSISTDSALKSGTDALVEKLYADKLSLRVSVGGDLIARNEDQINALKEAWNRPFTIIAGGPGTGKTSLLTNLLRGFIRLGISVDSISIAAPTGRASQRIVESLHRSLQTIQKPADEDLVLESLQGATLHRLLGYQPRKNRFRHHRKNPLSSGVIIIDEASMVDIGLMGRIFTAVGEGDTRVVLLGDQNQLPSVDSGAVLSDLVSRSQRHPEEISLVRLKRSYRSGGSLHEWSRLIMEGEGIPNLPGHTGSLKEALQKVGDHELGFLPFEGLDQFKIDLHSWAGAFFLKRRDRQSSLSYIDAISKARELDLGNLVSEDEPEFTQQYSCIFAALSHLEASKLLALTRTGPLGVESLNRQMHTDLGRVMGIQPGRRHLQGTPVMVTSNDHAKGLFNGDIGVLLKDCRNGLYVAFRTRESFRLFSLFELRSWEPAFAITVHKSQGSEYEDVLLVLPNQLESPLLAREVLYTGLTRARNRVFLYASSNIIEKCLSKKIQRTSRESLLSTR